MKKHLLIITFLITLFLSSCGILPITKNSDLNGTAWTLTNYNGTTLLSNTTMTAFFESGEVNGSAGCNHYLNLEKSTGPPAATIILEASKPKVIKFRSMA